MQMQDRLRSNPLSAACAIRDLRNAGCAQLKAADEPALGHVAEYFRALSQPMRLRILNTLHDRPRNVAELTQLLGCGQANVSRHLATLMRHGLVDRAPQGTSAYYRIADPGVYRLCHLVCGQLARRFAHQAQLLGTAAPTTRSRQSLP
jgi:DNA-binding transcriptional ArsR family regulator